MTTYPGRALGGNLPRRMLTHVLVQLQNVQLRHRANSTDQTRHDRSVSAVRDIKRLVQVPGTISQAKTASVDDLLLDALVVDVDAIIDQRDRHRLVQPKWPGDVLNEVRKLVHARQPSMAVFHALARNVDGSAPRVAHLDLGFGDVFHHDVFAEALEALPEALHVGPGALGAF